MMCLNARVHIWNAMVTKTITITEKAYHLLKRNKLPGESFSEALLRILDQNRSLDDLFGAWDGDEDEWTQIQATLHSSWGTWQIDSDE